MPGEKGHLKVFIGMAPGVGKTYRMLQEGVAEADSGRDVVIGYLEPHGRAETVAQAEGLESVPRRQVIYRGRTLEEMDLPAVLARKPELCLIDELAHTNAPGVEHEKRYEDVRDVLEAGIDVFATVNVQHLESLNDQVTQLTGARVRETIPDEVLSGADEVVLVDLTPEALIARLRAGKVYRPERVQAALNNFFKVENLSALRETALRQVAEDVEIKRLVREPSPVVRRDEEGLTGAPEQGPQAITERLLALATLAPHSERVVRRAWRSAQRLDAELVVLVVRPTGRAPSPEDRNRLEALRRLVSMLGASLRVEEGEDVAGVAIEIARALASTYVIMGTPAPRRGLGRLGRTAFERSLLGRILRELPGVDVRIVADPTLRGTSSEQQELAPQAGFGGESDEPSGVDAPL
jgi:two-component system, OmpR family, sensor histidine kinase KdpD